MIFGVELGARSVQVAALEKRLFSLRPVKLARLVFEPDEPDRRRRTVEFLIANGYDQDEDMISLIYPSEFLSTRLVRFPIKSEKLIRSFIPGEIEALTPFDPEDVLSEFEPIEPRDSRARDSTATLAALFITLKSDFEEEARLWSEAGLSPDAITPEPSALSHLIDEDADVALVCRNDGATILTLLKGGAIVGSRYLDVDLDPTRHDGDALAGRLKEVLTALSRLIRTPKSIGLEFELEKVITIGAPEDDSLFGDLVMERFGARLESFDLYARAPELAEDRADFKRAEIDGSHFASSYSAALQIATRSIRSRAPNFARAQYARRSRLVGSGAQTFFAVGLAAVAALVWIFSLALDRAHLESERDQLKERRSRLARELIPDLPSGSDPAEALIARLFELEQIVRAVGLGEDPKDPILSRAQDISAAIPPQTRIDITQLTYDLDSIVLAGVTDSFEDVELIKTELEKIDWALKVDLVSAKTRASGADVTFRFKIDLFES